MTDLKTNLKSSLLRLFQYRFDIDRGCYIQLQYRRVLTAEFVAAATINDLRTVIGTSPSSEWEFYSATPVPSSVERQFISLYEPKAARMVEVADG